MLTQQTLGAPSEIRQTEAHVLRFLSKIRPEAPKVDSRTTQPGRRGTPDRTVARCGSTHFGRVRVTATQGDGGVRG